MNHITVDDLGWAILAYLFAAALLCSIWDWFSGQYEVRIASRLLTRRARGEWALGLRPLRGIPFRIAITRRWYGTRAWVILRGHEDDDEPERYQVLGWDQEDTRVPWVRVMSIDNEDAESFWAPVTDFAPEAVRKLRPWIFRYRSLPVPVLFAYETLPRPAANVEVDA
jgi:hypothetical protein